MLNGSGAVYSDAAARRPAEYPRTPSATFSHEHRPAHSGRPLDIARRERDEFYKSVSHTAHSKVILFGEHSVVYGGPAIALPFTGLTLTATAYSSPGPIRLESAFFSGAVDSPGSRDTLAAPIKAINETLERISAPREGFVLRVDGQMPVGRGLGSSAAAAAAISGAVAGFKGVRLDPNTMFEIVQAAEIEAHGNPSGLDALAVTADAPLFFRSGTAAELVTSLDEVLLIADSGISAHTRIAVARVAAQFEQNPDKVRSIFAEIDSHTTAAANDLIDGDAESLGKRMSAVHEQLRLIGVSTSELDSLAAAALGAGALGAKLTGGGLGGCVLALVKEDQAIEVERSLRAAGAATTWSLRMQEFSTAGRHPND